MYRRVTLTSIAAVAAVMVIGAAPAAAASGVVAVGLDGKSPDAIDPAGGTLGAAPNLSTIEDWWTWVGPILGLLLVTIFVIGLAIRRRRMSARDIDGSRYRPRHR